MNRLLFVDVETTGFDPAKNEIISFAAIEAQITRPQAGSWPQLEPGRAWELHSHPINGIEEGAQEVNGYTHDKWEARGAVSREDFAKQVIGFIDSLDERPIIVGHNVGFDLGFLRALGVKGYLRQICTMQMSEIHDVLLGGESRRSLVALCARLGISHPNPHDAMADVQATLKLFRALSTNLALGNEFKHGLV